MLKTCHTIVLTSTMEDAHRAIVAAIRSRKNIYCPLTDKVCRLNCESFIDGKITTEEGRIIAHLPYCDSPMLHKRR